MKCEVFVNKVFEQNTYLLIDEKMCYYRPWWK